MTNLRISTKSVIVDANLLLLLIVGLWNPRSIATQKRLSDFTVDDFELLRSFLSTFQCVVTTAHILTEVSNLAGAASGQTRTAIFLQLAAVVTTLDEHSVPAELACTQAEFPIFGLPDAVLAYLCSDMLLLTEDGRLAAHLDRMGYATMNLNRIRSLYRSQQFMP